jgi:leucine dehydrogenase
VLFVSNRLKEESERRAMERAKDEFRAVEVTLDAHGLPHRFPDVLAYAPCALGGVVNGARIAAYPGFLKVIAGSANNVLLDSNRDGDLLMKRNIVYAPDYVANNRGLWDISHQMSGLAGYDAEKVRQGCKDNFELVLEILDRAEAENISPHCVADKMAEAIFMKKPV